MKFEAIADLKVWYAALKEMDEAETEKPMDKLIEKIRNQSDQTSIILGMSSYLEGLVNAIIDAKITNLKSTPLESWSKDISIPISDKLRILRFLDLINEKEYGETRTIFKVRNSMAHINQLKENNENPLRFISISKTLIKKLKLDTEDKRNQIRLLSFAMTAARIGWQLELIYKLVTKSRK